MGNLPSLDYAIMNNIGENGASIQKTLDRLKGNGGYDTAHKTNYHVLFVVNTLSQLNSKEDYRIRKHISFDLDTISNIGGWISMHIEGWPERSDCYYFPDIRLTESFHYHDIQEAKNVAINYELHDANILKRLAIVGFSNKNVTDPRKVSTLITKDNIKYHDSLKYRFATRGATKVVPGVRILNGEAPTFTVEEYDEAPEKMAREAHGLFLKAIEHIFEPKLIYSEFPNIISKQ